MSAVYEPKVSDPHPTAKGQLPTDGETLPPAAGLPTDGGRACASARGDDLPPREEGEDAAPAAAPPVIEDAVVIPPPPPAGGGSPAETGLAPAADPHGSAGAAPGASAHAAGVTGGDSDQPVPPAPLPAPPGADPATAAVQPRRRKPPRGDLALRATAGVPTDTGDTSAGQPPRKRSASRPPPSAGRHEDGNGGGAAAAGAGGAPPPPWHARRLSSSPRNRDDRSVEGPALRAVATPRGTIAPPRRQPPPSARSRRRSPITNARSNATPKPSGMRTRRTH